MVNYINSNDKVTYKRPLYKNKHICISLLKSMLSLEKHIVISLLVIITLVSIGLDLKSQISDNYYSISGVVRDKNSGKAVENVNVSAINTNIGTVTNEDGEFVLKLNENLTIKEIELSCIGYFNVRIEVSKNMPKNQTYVITSQTVFLDEVEVFSWKNPRDLIDKALEKVTDNYSMKPSLLTGFYRETIQKKNNYINISEAVIQVYKTSYMTEVNYDKVKILKGRNILSNRKNDTLDVKFVGGPNVPIFLDIVKNPDILFSQENLNCYAFKMGDATFINDRLQFVVHFEPVRIFDYPLYRGTLFIDRENLAFTRADFSMDMSDKLKVIESILREKPTGLRFTPEDITYIITYRQLNNKTYLNYIRNEIKFKCDWKRKLFATNFIILNETVITDIEEDNVTKITQKDAFSIRRALGREVKAYYDEDFWGAYNIIEPTESLENAVNRLKKQQN